MASAKPEGANSQLVRRMFEAGESMNVNNFAAFYGDDATLSIRQFPSGTRPARHH